MKKVLTLLFFTSICNLLFAAVPVVDTGKSTARDTSRTDSVTKYTDTKNLDFTTPSKHTQKYTLAAINHYSSDLAYDFPLTRAETYKDDNITYYPDSVAFTSYAKHTGAVTLNVTHNNKYNRSQVIHNADSLRLLAMLLKQDSIKFDTYRANKDSVQKRMYALSMDSLRLELKNRLNDIYKGQIYTAMATKYMVYDTMTNKFQRLQYQTRALNNTMLALHQFSYFNDTTGLRTSFDNLTKVYIAQKKFSEAKWFALQSNALSRAKNDQPNIIASLLTLASIKDELNDYTLAMNDLTEALQISIANKLPKLQSLVLKNFALLYSRMKNYPKEEAVLKKRDSLEEAMRRDEEAKMMASIAVKDSVDKKKADSVQTKKKVLTSNTRKLSKNNSPKKVAS